MSDETTFLREKHFSVTVTAVIDGTPESFGDWQKLDGGDVTSESTKTFPAGGKDAVVVPGGKASTDKITLTKQFSRKDAISQRARMKSLIGAGYEFTVSQAPLDYSNQPFATPEVDTGALETVTRVKADVNSDGIAEFSIVINPKG